MHNVRGLNTHTNLDCQQANCGSSLRHSPVGSSAASDRSFAVCVGTPSHARESSNKEWEDITFRRRDGKWGCTGSSCLPDRGISSLSWLCNISQRAGRPCGNRSPCPLPIPPFCFPSFSAIGIARRESVIAAAASTFWALCITAQSSCARLDRWARRPGARVSSVFACSVEYFAFT